MAEPAAQLLAEYILGMEDGLQPDSLLSNGEVILNASDWAELVRQAQALQKEGSNG